MKRLISFCFFVVAICGCSSNEDEPQPLPQTVAPPALLWRMSNPIMLDMPYGDEAQQTMDIYLPMPFNGEPVKTFVVIHGGGWSSGDKSAMASQVAYLRLMFPNYAVVNLNYRLATAARAGYPMQPHDIGLALQTLDAHAEDFNLSKQYAMIGISAGGHLAMLYAYKFDTTHEVKAVCSIVGPADFTDPVFRQYDLFSNGVNYLTGFDHFEKNPELFREVSPAFQVTSASAKTLLLYGNADPIVANTQGPIMQKSLSVKGVYNELYLYPGAGHANWNNDQQNHVNLMQYAFFKKVF